MSSFWLILKQQWTIKISSTLFSIFSLVAILVGSRDHRTQFWKGAIQGPFHHSLVQIGPVASEELIKMWKVNGRMLSGDAKNSTNQKQELPVVAMFVNGSRWNDQLKCEKLTRTDAKWWQKLTLPLARWAKMLAHYIQRISWVTYIRINET